MEARSPSPFQLSESGGIGAPGAGKLFITHCMTGASQGAENGGWKGDGSDCGSSGDGESVFGFASLRLYTVTGGTVGDEASHTR